MFDVRPLPALARRYYPLQYALGGLCLVCFGIVFARAGTRDGVFYGAVIGFVVTAVSTFFVDRRMIRQIPCPTCGQLLQRRKRPDGKMISVQYGCERCRVLWDADLKPGEQVDYSEPL